MSECRLISYIEDSRHPMHPGTAVARTRCETHGIDCGVMTMGQRCPIGAIEKATAEALEQIRAAAEALK